MRRRSARRWGHADPASPAVVLHRPLPLLDLEPVYRAAALVLARLVLGDVALVPALDHLLPRLQTIWRQPPHREDQRAAGDDVLDRVVLPTTLVP
jgi:hypothetical protein